MSSAVIDSQVLNPALLGSSATVSSVPNTVARGAGRVAGVLRAIDRLDVSGLVEGEHEGVLRELERARRRLEAASLRVLASAQKARVGERAGHTGTGSWVSSQTRCGGAEGSARTRLASDLDAGLVETGSSLERGEISVEHAQVIAATMRALPPELGADARAAVETRLNGRAREVEPGMLRRMARRALEAAQRSRAEVDAQEDAQLRGQEQQALARTRLTMRDNPDGTTSGHFTVPTLAGAMLRKVIQQIASPRRDRARQGQGLASDGSEDGATSYQDTDWAHRYGLALLEILEHLPTDRLAGKVAATVVATVPLDSLKDGLAAAHLDTGQAVSAGQARRLACNAGIVPVVLGGSSLPLDLGRADRFFSEAQRVALATLYTECAAVDCDRPYAWCELHHQDPWSRGGRTDLDKAVPLCGYHHRRIHDPEFEAQLITDGDGIKTVRLRQR